MALVFRNPSNQDYSRLQTAKVGIFIKQSNKKTNGKRIFYLERLPLKRMLATTFQKYFQSVRKGCSK